MRPLTSRQHWGTRSDTSPQVNSFFVVGETHPRRCRRTSLSMHVELRVDGNVSARAAMDGRRRRSRCREHRRPNSWTNALDHLLYFPQGVSADVHIDLKAHWRGPNQECRVAT